MGKAPEQDSHTMPPEPGPPDRSGWLTRWKLEEFPEPDLIRLNHPVLLCHGYGAIVSLVKPSPLHDVAMLMRSHGVAAVAPNIVPYARIETRAEEWASVIGRLVERTGIERWNVVAHSMGGLDMRWLLARHDMSDRVESFTTVCTPHRGTSLAELSLKTPETIRKRVGQFLDWMGDRIYPETKSDSVGSAEQLTRRYVQEEFNPSVPDREGIPYYSFGSAVGKGTEEPVQMVTRYQNSHIYREEGVNDGMVSVESSRWGTFIGVQHLSHLEQVNMGLKEARRPRFHAFWRAVLETLHDRGH